MKRPKYENLHLISTAFTILLFVRMYTTQITYEKEKLFMDDLFLVDKFIIIIGLLSSMAIFVSMLFHCFKARPLRKLWLAFMLLFPIVSSILYFIFVFKDRAGVDSR